MSRIDEMIARLCPDGVEYKALDEVFDTHNGYTPSKKNPAYWKDGTINWFRMEDIRANGRILSDSIQKVSESAIKGGRLFAADSLIVATSATIGEHALITVPFMCNQRFTCLTRKLRYVERLDMRFFFYYADVLDRYCLENTNSGGFASVAMNAFKKFRVPIPPMEIQREIVRILDLFVKLEAELEAELEARKAQYAYYRDQLLDFRERECSWLKLGNIGTFARGRRFTKSDYRQSGIPSIHYADIYTKFGTWTDTAVAYLDESKHDSLRYAQPGDVVIACTGEDSDDIAKAVAWLGDEPAAVHDDCSVFHHEQDSKYISYLFQTDRFTRFKKRYVTEAKMTRLSAERIAQFEVPVPPLAEQQRIVGILDRFDALTTSLTDGLPAEIEARRQQYEYYRDRLLDFPRKA